jgi:hypothetical protein
MSTAPRRALAALALLPAAGPAAAAPITQGNILVSDEVLSGPGRVREFTPAGVLVQTFVLAVNPLSDGPPRDLVVDANGNVQIYNGTLSPALISLDPVAAGVFRNTPFAGWSTVGNLTYGGVAAFDDFVFVTDMATPGPGSPNGIIRFDVNTWAGVRFGGGAAGGPGDTIDLTVGRDGLLYAQAPGTSPGGNLVTVYDPATLALVRQVDLGIDLRSIAVAANGDIFAVAFNSPVISRFSGTGALLQTLNPGVGGFADINLDATGRIVATAGGTLVLTTTALSGFTALNVGPVSGGGFVTFAAFVEAPLGPTPAAAVPEPASALLLGAGAAGLAAARLRRRATAS